MLGSSENCCWRLGIGGEKGGEWWGMIGMVGSCGALWEMMGKMWEMVVEGGEWGGMVGNSEDCCSMMENGGE